MELKFRMFTCQLSEIFWEIVRILYQKLGLKLNICGARLLMRFFYYALVISEARAPFQDCVGFIDCAKMRM